MSERAVVAAVIFLTTVIAVFVGVAVDHSPRALLILLPGLMLSWLVMPTTNSRSR